MSKPKFLTAMYCILGQFICQIGLLSWLKISKILKRFSKNRNLKGLVKVETKNDGGIRLNSQEILKSNRFRYLIHKDGEIEEDSKSNS